jgi:hypothetical protein
MAYLLELEQIVIYKNLENQHSSLAMCNEANVDQCVLLGFVGSFCLQEDRKLNNNQLYQPEVVITTASSQRRNI